MFHLKSSERTELLQLLIEYSKYKKYNQHHLIADFEHHGGNDPYSTPDRISSQFARTGTKQQRRTESKSFRTGRAEFGHEPHRALHPDCRSEPVRVSEAERSQCNRNEHIALPRV